MQPFDGEHERRKLFVPMNSDQVWLFSVAKGLNGHDVGALVLVWIWTLGFLVLGVMSGRPMSLLVGSASLLVAVPWTVGRMRSRRRAIRLSRDPEPRP